MKVYNIIEVLEKHKKWLNNEAYGKRADLEGTDLRSAFLENADLRNANLRGADLEGANLRNANLEGAKLRNANLRGANLGGADLEGTYLRDANLKYANLEGANLENANLENANLEGTKFYLTDLYRVQREDLFGIENIGSRNDTTHYFVESNRIICGCFDGSLEEFEKKVKNTYEKVSREYKEYIIAIDTLKKYRDMYLKESVKNNA